jgi:predicted NBD/HSP70 family sugar kinase
MGVAGSSWPPLQGAQRAIAVEALIFGPVSRAEISRRLDLSPATVTRLTRPLLDMGLLIESGSPTANGLGRPSVPLTVDAASRHFVGVKLTAEGVHGVLTDLRATVLAKETVPLLDRKPAAVVEATSHLVKNLGSRVAAVRALGVSAGGVTEDRAVLKHAGPLGWTEDVPLASMLTSATGIPTAIENDVAAWLEVERWFGEGRDQESFALLTMGVGVGYALASGSTPNASDVGVGLAGHVPLDPWGWLCPSGHHGCADAMLTSGAIAAAASVGLRRPVTYAEVLDLADAGDPVAGAIVEASARACGRLVAMIANLTLVPLVIVSGDGVDLAIRHRDTVVEEFRRHRHPMAHGVEVLIKQAPFTEWARGAATVAIQTYVLGR